METENLQLLSECSFYFIRSMIKKIKIFSVFFMMKNVIFFVSSKPFVFV